MTRCFVEYDHRDADGWPIGISTDSKRWAIEQVRNALRERGDVGLTLLEARRVIFDEPHDSRPAAFWIARMKPWELAVAHKVLEEVGTKAVWVLEELRREFDDD